MTAAWSPSRAREAARAALCRYLVEDPERYGFGIAAVRELLADDSAFDTRKTFLRAVVKTCAGSREIRALLDEAPR